LANPASAVRFLPIPFGGTIPVIDPALVSDIDAVQEHVEIRRIAADFLRM
jgi:hypothetical protein